MDYRKEYESIPSLLEQMPDSGLSNLHEKLGVEYIDTGLEIPDYYDQMPEDVKAIVDSLTKKAMETKFLESDNDTRHAFINCDSELSRKIGIDNLMLCPYKGYELGPIESNYITYKTDEKVTFTIDVYDVHYAENKEEYVRILIAQELINFARDCQWLVEGSYEKNMSLMRQIVLCTNELI